MKRIYSLVASCMVVASLMAQYVPNSGSVMEVNESKPYVSQSLNFGWTGEQPEGFSAFILNASAFKYDPPKFVYSAEKKATILNLEPSVNMMIFPAVAIKPDLIELTVKLKVNLAGATFGSDLTAYEKERTSNPDPNAKVMKYIGMYYFTDENAEGSQKLSRDFTKTTVFDFFYFADAQRRMGDGSQSIPYKGLNLQMGMIHPYQNGDYVLSLKVPESYLAANEGKNLSVGIIYFADKPSPGVMSFSNLKMWDSALSDEPADPSPTAIEQTKAEVLKAYGSQGMITINAQEGSAVSVSNLVGQEVKSLILTSRTQSVNMPAGIYVVSSNGKAKKVVVQ